MSRTQHRVARLLTLSEIACSLVLVIGSGLLLKSLLRVLQIPLGFDPEQALVIRTTFNRQRYSPEKRHAVERAVAARLRSLPGVAAVAITTHVPLADQRQIGFVIDGAPPDEFHWADNALVSGDYFRVMRIPLLSGRTFSDHDTPQSPLVAVINQTMARRYWPGQKPVGKGFKWGGRHIIVAGVAGDIHVDALDRPIGPQIYNPVFQIESGASASGVFLLRTRGPDDPMRLAESARNAIWSVDHGLPILGFGTLHGVVAASLLARRAAVTLVTAFALLAMALSLIGIYGVLSRAVIQRTQEIGIRLALGARPGEISGLILREELGLAAAGILFGLSTAALAGAAISKLLFDVNWFDPITYAAGSGLILLVAVLASYLPARRASRLDPVAALRYE